MSGKDIYFYKFFYKDELGIIKSEIIEIIKKDNELAIAKFEKLYPDITWRSFSLIS